MSNEVEHERVQKVVVEIECVGYGDGAEDDGQDEVDEGVGSEYLQHVSTN